MSKIAISPGATGDAVFTLQAPSTDTSRTLTLPDNSGTLLSNASTFAGTGPAFSAYLGSSQTPSANTWTTMIFNTEEFDTDSCFNTSTYTFTPTVAGYYQFIASWNNSGSAATYLYVALAKNGTRVKNAIAPDASGGGSVNRSALIYMNGSTDYVVAQMYTNAATAGSGAIYSNFQGFLARAA